jgi:hypothetical protein
MAYVEGIEALTGTGEGHATRISNGIDIMKRKLTIVTVSAVLYGCEPQ